MKWTPMKIRALREKLGFTQQEMAKALGYRRYQTVLEFETGRRTPPATAQRLLDSLEKQIEQQKKGKDIMSREEVKEKLELAAIPIDFDKLIQEGILEKRGAWYLVKDFERLPEHAKIKANKMKSSNEGVLVKFSKRK